MKHNYYFTNSLFKFLEISGSDRTEFLQGIITNDINKCSEKNNLLYSCFLSPQGKFLADFFISYNVDYYLLEIHHKYYDMFYDKLKIYKLRSDLKFNENKNLISLVTSKKNKLKFNNAKIICDDPRSNELGIKIYLDKKNFDHKTLNNLKKLSNKDYKEILIKNLIPYAPDDLIEGKSLLLENNFQNINAIDWNKGCYIGQEITARMKYRSLLKKKIYVLELLEGDINPGEDITLNNIKIGNVISKVNKYILCMLKINLIDNVSKNKDKIKISSNLILKFL